MRDMAFYATRFPPPVGSEIGVGVRDAGVVRVLDVEVVAGGLDLLDRNLPGLLGLLPLLRNGGGACGGLSQPTSRTAIMLNALNFMFMKSSHFFYLLN